MEYRAVRDQMGFLVTIPKNPSRIVSLVPSITEFLHDIGLENQIVGITKFCVHPKHYKSSKVIIGGTKNFKLDIIKKLNPDLILANKEENDKDRLLFLKNAGFPVWISDVKNIEEALDMMQQIGIICNAENASVAIIKDLIKFKKWFKSPDTLIPSAYLIWRRPYMSINQDTFIHHMMRFCGLDNVFAQYPDRYPEISEEDLKSAHPRLVILSTEPYPFSEKHFPEIEDILPDASLLLGDGDMFSWYGSRMILAFEYFERIRKNIVEPLRKLWAI